MRIKIDRNGWTVGLCWVVPVSDLNTDIGKSGWYWDPPERSCKRSVSSDRPSWECFGTIRVTMDYSSPIKNSAKNLTSNYPHFYNMLSYFL